MPGLHVHQQNTASHREVVIPDQGLCRRTRADGIEDRYLCMSNQGFRGYPQDHGLDRVRSDALSLCLRVLVVTQTMIWKTLMSFISGAGAIHSTIG